MSKKRQLLAGLKEHREKLKKEEYAKKEEIVTCKLIIPYKRGITYLKMRAGCSLGEVLNHMLKQSAVTMRDDKY